MENNLNIIQTEEGIKVIETKQYTMTINEIKSELNNISWQKDDLIKQSQRIKSEFNNLSNREKELKSALDKLETNENGLEVLE